jgi:hypothetical protein
MKHLLKFSAAILSLGCFLSAAEPTAFFEQHCIECHDGDTMKGGLDLSSLALQLDEPANFETWVKVHDALGSGEMPPKKKTRPPVPETAAFLADLDAKLIGADEARIAREGGRAVLRRLTRTEYENAMRDLLALPELHVQELLPADGSRHGFDKITDNLIGHNRS